MKNIFGQQAKLGDQIGFIHEATRIDGVKLVAKSQIYTASERMALETECCASENPDGYSFYPVTSIFGAAPVPNSQIIAFKTRPYIYGLGKNQ